MTINRPIFAPEQTSKWIPLILENVKYIIVHHAAAVFATYESINQWHIENGWAGFGYNEYIRKDGSVYIGRGDNIGAQCAAMNSVSYGICCEGDYDNETTMPELQKLSLIERIRVNRLRFVNFKCTALHSQFFATSCPGKNFPLAEILKRSEVRNLTLDEAIQVLVKEGVINGAEYRKKVCDVVNFEKEFTISVAQKIIDLKNK